MRIGIDARLYNESGLGRYIRNLLQELQKIDKENEYYIFLLKKDISEIKLNKNFHKVEAEVRWYGLAEQVKLSRIFNKYNLDLLHVPHFNVPIRYKGKLIVTIHDLIHQHVDMKRASTHNIFLYKVKKIAYRKVFGTAIKKGQKIITISNFVKQQLIDEWKVPVSKIDITYEAVDESIIDLSQKTTKEDINAVLTKYKIRPPFIFYVGNAHPHKNVEGLIEAFLLLRKKYQYLTLVLAGHDHYFWKRIQSQYSSKDINFVGKVTDEELVSLYKSAECFVTTTTEEGFGIPILEAMACDCPVVCSNVASLPEVGGDAAIYFDPANREDVIEKITSVLNSKKIQQELKTKGREQFKKYSWNKLAKETLSIYKEVSN